MRAQEFITLMEKTFPKGRWDILLSTADKEEHGDELVNLVGRAYKYAPLGSFVTSVKEVIPSDWHVIDWDEKPDVDAAIFYRKPRADENWIGNKIQGIGHDGQPESKRLVLEKLVHLLKVRGNWIESSDALRSTLVNKPLPVVTDENLLKILFNDDSLKMIDRITYVRKLQDNNEIIETVFGIPVIKDRNR